MARRRGGATVRGTTCNGVKRNQGSGTARMLPPREAEAGRRRRRAAAQRQNRGGAEVVDVSPPRRFPACRGRGRRLRARRCSWPPGGTPPAARGGRSTAELWEHGGAGSYSDSKGTAALLGFGGSCGGEGGAQGCRGGIYKAAGSNLGRRAERGDHGGDWAGRCAR